MQLQRQTKMPTSFEVKVHPKDKQEEGPEHFQSPLK